MKTNGFLRIAGVAQWQSRSFPSLAHSQKSAIHAVNRAKSGHAESIAYRLGVNRFAPLRRVA